jgi:hypothetical protein
MARKARGKALGPPGTPVCSYVNVGVGREAMIRGVTAGLKNDKLNVTITAVNQELLPEFQSGDTVQTGMWDWTPCL